MIKGIRAIIHQKATAKQAQELFSSEKEKEAKKS